MTPADVRKSTYEWDDNKATTNLIKHRISFDEAVYIFTDPDAINTPAKLGKNGEIRRAKTGSIHPTLPLITIVYTTKDNGKTIRIISARAANKIERMQYGTNKPQNK